MVSDQHLVLLAFLTCHAHSTLGPFYCPCLASTSHSGFRSTWNVTSSQHFSEQLGVSPTFLTPFTIPCFMLPMALKYKIQFAFAYWLLPERKFHDGDRKLTHLQYFQSGHTLWIHVGKQGLDPAADKPRLQGDSSSVAGEVLLSEGEPPSLPLAPFSNIWFGDYRVNLIRQLAKSPCGGRKLSKICRGTLVLQTQGCRNFCSREQERRQKAWDWKGKPLLKTTVKKVLSPAEKEGHLALAPVSTAPSTLLQVGIGECLKLVTQTAWSETQAFVAWNSNRKKEFQQKTEDHHWLLDCTFYTHYVIGFWKKNNLNLSWAIIEVLQNNSNSLECGGSC